MSLPIPLETAAPIRIVGAGPSGLTAAIALARAGRAVEVFERRGDCGLQFRGDLQGLENWTHPTDVLDHLETMGLGCDVPCTPFRRAWHTNGRRTIEHTFSDPIFYLVRRGAGAGTLDTWLKERALAAGVRIRFGETIAPETADISATGPDPRRPFAVDTGFVFQTDAPDMAVVLTNDRAAIKGYSYLLVANGHGCLCTMLFERFRDAPASLVRAREVLAGGWNVRVEDPRPVGGVGHFAASGPYQRGRAMVVGEAAGVQDLLWGFGIRTAVASGHLAAQCLLDSRDYTEAARAVFHRHQRAGVVNRFLWETLRHGNYAFLMRLLHVGGRPLLQSFYGYNLLQRILYPLAQNVVHRWHPRTVG